MPTILSRPECRRCGEELVIVEDLPRDVSPGAVLDYEWGERDPGEWREANICMCMGCMEELTLCTDELEGETLDSWFSQYDGCLLCVYVAYTLARWRLERLAEVERRLTAWQTDMAKIQEGVKHGRVEVAAE